MKPDFWTEEYRHAVEWRNRWLPNVPIYDSLPDGWRRMNGAATAPNGTVWIATGSLFWRTRGGKPYRHALMWS